MINEEEFYEGITKQIDDTKDKLSALEKILKAFEKKEEGVEESKTLTDNNLKSKKR